MKTIEEYQAELDAVCPGFIPTKSLFTPVAFIHPRRGIFAGIVPISKNWMMKADKESVYASEPGKCLEELYQAFEKKIVSASRSIDHAFPDGDPYTWLSKHP